jgi:uncharacterized protein
MQCLLRYCCIILWTLCGVSETPAEQANAMRAPRLSQPAERPAPPIPEGSLPALVFDAYLRFFQQVISPVDGPRSTMYPTGSAYARQVIKKHGALLGVVLTTERLMHEGNEDQVAPRIRKYGIWRVYDPVEANDWWWSGSDWVYQPASDLAGKQ